MREFKNGWQFTVKSEQRWRDKRQPKQKLVIEIGAGVGYHPIQYAYANYDKFIVAIERTHIKATKMQHRIENHQHLENIYGAHADAIAWICQNIKDNEVDEYFMLYPNPYPKEKQANKRFMNMPFMQKLIKTMKSGAKLTVATNQQFYYIDARDKFCNEWGLELVVDEILPFTATHRTHFEKKYLARGESCYNLVFVK